MSVIPGGNRTIVEDKYTEKHRSRDTIKRKERNGNGNVKQYKARILVLRKTWVRDSQLHQWVAPLQKTWIYLLVKHESITVLDVSVQ